MRSLLFFVVVLKLVVVVFGFVVGVDVISLLGNVCMGCWIEFGGMWDLYKVFDFNFCMGFCVRCFLV